MMAKARGMSVEAMMGPALRDTANAGGNGSSSSSSDGSSQQNKKVGDTTFHSFDKDGLCKIQSQDENHNITCDQKGKKITLNIPIGEWGYAGGDGGKGKYARIMTEDGPSVNFKARIG